MKHCLVVELWWIGDATLTTSALQGLLADGWTVTVLAKSQTRALLAPSYPEVGWIEFDAPWTRMYGKYRLWRWPWVGIFRVLGQLRARRFDAALSIREDPREHFFLWLGGIKRRIGFPSPGSWLLLNEPIPHRNPEAHRVEDWWNVQQGLTSPGTPCFAPRLLADGTLVKEYQSRLHKDPRPVIALHCGARNVVRRWPEAYFRELVTRLRQEFDFQLVLFPDLDGYGSSLQDMADHTLVDLDMAHLLAALSCSAQLICNDSGPSHLADALGVSVIAIFGPGRAEKLRPFREHNLVVIRDICPFHPCSDYCRFPEAYCLTQLTPAIVWPEIRDDLLRQGLIPHRTPVSPASAEKGG